MTPYPMAMQMRYLQALAEVASEKNSTIIFPLPLELLAPFLKNGRDGASAAALTNGRPEDASLGLKDSAQSEQATGQEQHQRRWGERPVACSCPGVIRWKWNTNTNMAITRGRRAGSCITIGAFGWWSV